MKLKDQAMLANLAIFGGMVVAYFQGISMLYIVGGGVLAFVVVSAVFIYRMKKAKRQGSGVRAQGSDEQSNDEAAGPE